MGDKDTSKKIHWKKWSDFCYNKADGGLGFKDFGTFNRALLAKQWWIIFHNDKLLSH